MLSQRETRSIPVDVIDFRHRRQMPSDTEINEMVNSIEREGLLLPVGVHSTGENSYRLVHGATRLAAVKKLGWQEIPATILEGTAADTASAEIVENLARRHLDKDQRDELTRAYVELHGSPKELNDNLSRNSSPALNTHPNVKVEGAKRGRPSTPGGQSKKKAAILLGRSLRTIQRATSTKPKGAACADRDARRLKILDQVKRPVADLKDLLSASVLNHGDREQLRKQHQPYLDGFITEFGKLRFTVEPDAEDVGATNDHE
jgi:hypothetical protein